ncbi:hypothetical protein BDFB_001945 [Asbolus verrucosus]|uniref:Uncharacterized protein n=1 Tax=Asbolus verrucosus TaxID=1661398 RepID=A0A482WD74_ASBVE|nr:hypothetical protein BDFB_001945 [Asbolus verrucosus]
MWGQGFRATLWGHKLRGLQRFFQEIHSKTARIPM